MYLPRHFEPARPDAVAALIRSRPFATLVTHGPDGLTADHVPMEFLPGEGAHGLLRFHVARMNPVWQALAARPEALAIFQGPEAYITPSWYPEKQATGKVVPTWNYAIVHARGMVRVVEDPAWLRTHLEHLVDAQEAALPQPWKVDDAPRDYTDKLVGMIVGLELAISSIQAKWKVSQNRAKSDREGVAAGLRARNLADDAEMAALVDPAPQP